MSNIFYQIIIISLKKGGDKKIVILIMKRKNLKYISQPIAKKVVLINEVMC